MSVWFGQNIHKEYVSLIIGLYKNNGSVLHVAIRLLHIPPASWCVARCTLYFDTHLHGILPWADINRNGNIFLGECTFFSFPPPDFWLLLGSCVSKQISDEPRWQPSLLWHHVWFLCIWSRNLRRFSSWGFLLTALEIRNGHPIAKFTSRNVNPLLFYIDVICAWPG